MPLTNDRGREPSVARERAIQVLSRRPADGVRNGLDLILRGCE